MRTRPIRRRAVPEALAFGETLHPVLRRVYAARGVASTDDLDLGLDRLLPVGTLDGVETAAELLATHVGRGSRILVVGDFDADGATASAVVVRALRRLGHAEVGFLVPDRFRFGYGLTPEIVALAHERRPALLVTVDNGVSSVAGVKAARALGMDVLVTDHHLPGMELPDATAMVNPNLAGCAFGSRALAGCGVAFYVMAALARRLGAPASTIVDLLDLVALGTVADVVPLDRNNRILVAQGLRRIRAGRCVPGIAALAEVAGRRLAALGATDLGFFLGPRLNAAGRLDDMSIGIECLLTDDPARARELAEQLDRLNAERRVIEGRMQEDALEIVRRMKFDAPGAKLPGGLCLYDESWHPGVVGLVAARVKEHVHRPVIAFAPADGGFVRGSARSVAGVHVRDVIEAVATREPGLVEKFGGHAMAAGLTVADAKLPRFAEAFADEVARRADPSALQGILVTDGALAAPELCLETAESLRGAGPWGQAFPEPTFDNEFAVVEVRTLKDQHLKLWVRPDLQAPPVEAIAFGWVAKPGHVPPRPQTKVQLVYRLDVNEYQGLRRPQLLVDYVEPRPG
ncbi:MAG: single-stranded-DNA-specific exonuclease RecJ [Steroidobacteraceae bacterium]|jgi:single-stranded-DNA-specific exonuclease|nr:single-stranded-DNA-specific exonuclease RecJ [Steroidobacteraceae bacterium]